MGGGCGGSGRDDPADAAVAGCLPPLLLAELDLEVEVFPGVPFFSSSSFLRAFRSAHQMVMDWLRFSLLTRGFFLEPDKGVESS